ncbi:MAG: peptidylprolyl isomerase [Prolixibacteraceae bacterium]|jgi:peptidyl-prolyl cis-trans isomerase SurA|nr:peptidylprolyl isomerase [Prolixibacteraceae bacterium]
MQNNKKLVALIIFINLFTFNALSQDKNIDQIIAVIGDNIILKSDIEGLYLQNQAQGITSEGDMKCEVLEDLLVEKLLIAEAQLDTNIIVTPSQINQQLDARIDYFLQHLGSQDAVEKYFNKTINTLKSELREVIENEILSSQMRNKIIENAKATPSEVRYFYRNLPDSEKSQIAEQYEYAQITILPRIDEKEENRIKDELRQIKNRVESGENFTMFAVLYSEGPSASSGGDLGYFARTEMDPAFSQAAFNLKPGQISNVVKSEFGYHLIQMIDRNDNKVRCRHVIMKPKVDAEVKEKALAAMDSLITDIRSGKISFAEAARHVSHDKDSRNSGGLVVNPQTMSSRFEANTLPPDVSKVLTKLNINEVSDPFLSINEKQREEIKVVKLLNKIDRHTANLSEDYPLISNMFLQKKQTEIIQKWVAERQAKTYIRIDPTYQNCDFRFENWIK